MTLRARYGEWAIVAGATEGIGEQFSIQLAAQGFNMLLIARKQDGLQRVADHIQKQFPQQQCDTLSLDLADPQLAEKLTAFVAEREVGLMVYNAVYSWIGNFVEDTLPSQQLCLDVNCKGPLTFINVLSKAMLARKRGGIILVSSMSGFQGSSMVTTYAASKAFVTILAEGLWYELKPKGVDVLTCVAGATLTPNFKRQTPAEKIASVMPMTPEAVVSEALKAFEKGKGPTVVLGNMNKLIYFLFSRLLSRKQAVNIISKATTNLYKNKNAL